MTKKFKNLLSQFRRNENGNVGMMFAVSFTASMIGIGAAIDLALVNKSKSQLQSMTDAATLAAAHFEGTTEERKQFFVDYLQATKENANYKADIKSVDFEVDLSAEKIILNAKVNASHPLLMMQMFTDFDGIKSSTTAEIGINDIEVALVLDISSSMVGNRITEAKKSTQFFVDKILTNEDTTEKRISVSLVPFGGTVRVPADMNYLLETPTGGLDAYSSQWIDNKWNQCFEYDNDDIRSGIKTNAKYRVTPDYWSWNSTNPWCPRVGSEFVPLTNDKDVLNAKIDTLTLSDGTGSDHGMRWGYEMLNPQWRNKLSNAMKDTPADNTRKTKKIIVFMTDGGITSQHYVRDEDKTGNPPYNSKRKVSVSYNDSLTSFYSICDQAKAENIEIYAIGYTITKSKHIDPLKNCVSKPENYINAASGKLEQVFSGLASTISPLRLTN